MSRTFNPQTGVLFMADRDVERNVNPAEFAKVLRRVADALETGESFRIQVANKRFTVPKAASISIEHEVEDGDAELELQFTWSEK
jgi:amphi-Trp domain-containing protein